MADAAILPPAREWKLKHWAAVAVLLIGAGLLIESWWVTDAEAIEDQAVALGGAMERGDIDAGVAVLAQDFDWGSLTREQMRLALGWVAQTYAPTKANPSELDTVVSGDTAVSDVMWHVTARFKGRGVPGTLRTKLAWKRTPAGWRCTSFSVDESPLELDLLGGGSQRVTPSMVRRMARLMGN